MSSRRRRPKGEGTYVQRPGGTWAYVADLGKDPETGARRRRWISAATRAELKLRIADEIARAGGALRARPTGTVGAWVEQWLNDEVKPNRGPGTYALYEGVWRVHAAPIVAGIELAAFNEDTVDVLYRSLRKQGVSANTIRRVGLVLHRAFVVAIRRRIYPFANPFDNVEKPRHIAKEGRFLTAPEARRFLEAAREDRHEALWVILVTAGLRLGEGLALRWSDVDFDRKTLSINRSFVEVGGYIHEGRTKTKGSRRLVDLGNLAIAALRRRQKLAQEEDHESELIFPTLAGKPLRRSNVRRSHFEPVCKRAKLSGIRIHDLRHAMTSLAIAAGSSAKVVAERLGHSTTRLTQDRYAHVLPGLQRETAEAIDAALAAPKKSARRPSKRPRSPAGRSR